MHTPNSQVALAFSTALPGITTLPILIPSETALATSASKKSPRRVRAKPATPQKSFYLRARSLLSEKNPLAMAFDFLCLLLLFSSKDLVSKLFLMLIETASTCKEMVK
jgi:hypothetical protein